jgi:hypothetical protein
MTLAEAQDLLGAWNEEPPAFLSLARIEAMLGAFLGVKGRGKGAAQPDELAAWRARLGQGDVHRGFAGAAILDFAELKRRVHG